MKRYIIAILIPLCLSSCFKEYEDYPNPLKGTSWKKVDSTLSYVFFIDFIQFNYDRVGDCYESTSDEYEVDYYSNKIYRYDFGNGEFQIRHDTLTITTTSQSDQYVRIPLLTDTLVICSN